MGVEFGVDELSGDPAKLVEGSDSMQPSNINLNHNSGNVSAFSIEQLIDSAMDDFTSAGLRLDRALVHRYVASLLTKRFVILTGLSGSGKTKLAQAFAAWITPLYMESSNWIQVGAELPADRVFYRVDAVDSISIQMSNDRSDGQRTKVTLPRELITEWVTCIKSNGYTRQTPARTIREDVGSSTRFSTQLNSFETHLKAAAFALIESETKQGPHSGYEIVAVGADWSSNEHVLGYADALHPKRYAHTQALDLVLRARENSGTPYFLILDEMNLSHVERYFADVLSSIESGEPIHLYDDSGEERELLRDGVPQTIKLPDNLFTVGTVNVDETTYMFSPKVLDRANTIEFRVDETQLEAFLNIPSGIDLAKLRGKGVQFARTFFEASREPNATSAPEIQARVNDELRLFFHVMAGHGYEFGYRTALEITRFVRHHQRLSPRNWTLEDAMDAQIYQKLLPRLNGSRARLEPVLRSLSVLCSAERQWEIGHNPSPQLINRGELITQANSAGNSTQFSSKEDLSNDDSMPAMPPVYPLSMAKIQRMYRLLRQNGFTSFAEA